MNTIALAGVLIGFVGIFSIMYYLAKEIEKA